MKTARVLTPWKTITPGTSGFTRPQLGGDYSLLTALDVTAQPASNVPTVPNFHTVEVTCADAVMTQIQADVKYFVIWVDFPGAVMADVTFTALLAFLATAGINANLGASVAGRTNAQIEGIVTAVLKGLPKGP